MNQIETKEVLIASVTPQFLERGVLWFQENVEKIRHAVQTEGFWQSNAFILEKEEEIKRGEFLRRLTDFGYEKTGMLFGKGEFSHRGNVIDVWPVNSDAPCKIEFFGNRIEAIYLQPTTRRQQQEQDNQANKRTRLTKTAGGLKKLKSGDYVVHVDHGIGVFRGITAKEVQAQKTETAFENLKLKIENSTKNSDEFFVVEYAPPRDGGEPDRLFVPITQERRLSSYIGFETPTVHRLGGSLWAKTRRKVKEDAEKVARELLKIYAARENQTRPPYQTEDPMEKEFADAFEFVETEDQTKAIGDIMKDFKKERPMDRIICGDVGFGKTEVAMRAALASVINGYQVAVITPTTILAHEHERNFKDRFQKFPVRVSSLSRLTPPRDERKIIEELRSGMCDIVVGTHRLLSKDIAFKNLRLVIVDEEQKFGVKQKEKFKDLRASCDILSLSATPIPRTLNLALSKLRDLSVISTPPPGRLPIKTFILPHSYKTFARAIVRELDREGQVYFLHNRIETIEKVREKLSRALSQVPTFDNRRSGLENKKIRIEIIHGRMDEKTMIRIMDGFRRKETRVLLATTIIENGLDFSNANTLIVDDGTRLGLAQAHQIRGRIGRGDNEAFAYFAYRPRAVTDRAMERLVALKEFEELGSGYEIALRALEMRGAGNILGREQSGAINRVGLNLYCQILADAVEELKSKKDGENSGS